MKSCSNWLGLDHFDMHETCLAAALHKTAPYIEQRTVFSDGTQPNRSNALSDFCVHHTYKKMGFPHYSIKYLRDMLVMAVSLRLFGHYSLQ